MINYSYITNLNDDATPFHHDSRTYCAKCSMQKKWITVKVSVDKNGYIFECHGEQVQIECYDFIKNNRIQGPFAKSFIVFTGKENKIEVNV